MKKILFTFLLLLAGICNCLYAIDIEQGYEVLDKVYSQYDFGDLDYSCTVTLITEKPDEPKNQTQFKLFERESKEQFTLIQIIPEADKGSGYLREGDNLWYYDPTGRKFSHTSIKENIGESDAKVSDINTESSWRNDYEVTSVAEDKLGSFEVYVISVKAISSKPAYSKDVYYIRKDIPLILKEENYSASDRLMRTTLVPKYAKAGGKYVAVHAIIRDELNKGEQTQQIISDIKFGKLPDKVFTKAYLEQIN